MKWKDKYRYLKIQLQLYCDLMQSEVFSNHTYEDHVKLCVEISRLHQIIKKIEAMPYIATTQDANDYEILMNSNFKGNKITEEFLLSLQFKSTSTGSESEPRNFQTFVKN